MTDKLPPLATQIVPPSQPVYSLPTVAPVQNDAPREEVVDEEPYTIKCICAFTGDDGNTIYCEACDTWQHIECYYPDNKDPDYLADFAHSCVDCNPDLDRRKAIERQKTRTNVLQHREEEAADKKVKRQPAKCHKKKPKPSDLQINGHATGTDGSKHGSPHEQQPPTKKTKSAHKNSQAVSSQVPAPKRSPSYGNVRNGQGHPPSPATTPSDRAENIDIHGYSSGFFNRLEKNVTRVNINSYERLDVAKKMSEWLRSQTTLEREVGRSSKEVLHELPETLDTSTKLVTVHRSEQVIPGRTQPLPWKTLKAASKITEGALLLEVHGQIGFQYNYSADPSNQYSTLIAPLPFVLFLRNLPLYIDTRSEGSDARYVRPSCQPNAHMETYVAAGQYHFWLVSDRTIQTDEEVTIPWEFRLDSNTEGSRWRLLLGLGVEDPNPPEPDITEKEYTDIAGWIHNLLSEYGGCACNLGNDCVFVRFHRNYHNKHLTRTNPPKKKVRKPKAQHTISPTSTGHATNSRAPSEGHMDDVPEQDGRSVSGSSRSKPPSRDMTPVARQDSLDTLGILTEPTDRDKRKVAMVEDSFRRMEQQQPPRKKKRTSDGPVVATSNSSKAKAVGSSAAQTPSHPGSTSERRYVDAGTWRSKSGSPAHTVPPSFALALNGLRSREDFVSGVSRSQSIAPANPSFSDAAVQTDPEEHPWYDGVASHTPTPKRKVVSLSKRLLNSRHHKKLDLGRRDQQQTLGPKECSTPMDVDSPTETKLPRSSSVSRDAGSGAGTTSPGANCSHDTVMPDAPIASPSTPSHILPPTLGPGSTKIRSPELRVQLPPVASFRSQSSAVSTASTPLSGGGPFAQSPVSGIGASMSSVPGFDGLTNNPSPVKKKLSLSDYTRQRKEAAGGKPSHGPTGLRPLTKPEEPRSASSVENGMFSDSPIAERTTASDPSVSPATASTTAAQV